MLYRFNMEAYRKINTLNASIRLGITIQYRNIKTGAQTKTRDVHNHDVDTKSFKFHYLKIFFPAEILRSAIDWLNVHNKIYNSLRFVISPKSKYYTFA